MKNSSKEGTKRSRSEAPMRVKAVIETPGSPKVYSPRPQRIDLFHTQECECYTCKKHQIKKVREDEFITNASRIILIGSIAVFVSAFIPTILLAVLSILSSMCAISVLMFISGISFASLVGSALIFSSPQNKNSEENDDNSKPGLKPKKGI